MLEQAYSVALPFTSRPTSLPHPFRELAACWPRERGWRALMCAGEGLLPPCHLPRPFPYIVRPPGEHLAVRVYASEGAGWLGLCFQR